MLSPISITCKTLTQIVRTVSTDDLIDCLSFCCENPSASYVRQFTLKAIYTECTAVQFTGGGEYRCSLLDCRDRNSCPLTPTRTGPSFVKLLVMKNGTGFAGPSDNGTSMFQLQTFWVAMLRVPETASDNDAWQHLRNSLGNEVDSEGLTIFSVPFGTCPNCNRPSFDRPQLATRQWQFFPTVSC